MANVANTIKQQIGTGALMAVAARNFVALENEAGLMFEIGSGRGMLKKVVIKYLPGLDLYKVERININRRTWTHKVRCTFGSVYADYLSEAVLRAAE
jgi:hypothetical protein